MVRILLLLFFVLNGCDVHAADDMSARLKNLKKKAREVEGAYISEQKKLRSIDDAISRIQGRIPAVQANVQKKQEQAEFLDRQIGVYESDLGNVREKIRKEWIAIYKSVSLDMVTVYYGHEKYAGYLNAIFRDHARTLKEYQGIRERLSSTKKKADDVSVLLSQDLRYLQASARELENERGRKAQLVSSLKGQSQEYQDEIENLIKEIQKRERERKEREKRELARKLKEKREREKKEKRRIEKKPVEPEPPVPSGAFSLNRGKMHWPVKGRIIRGFGNYTLRGVLQKSQGIDIEAAEGAPVSSVFSGRVVYADWMGRYGNTVILDHGDGFYSIYGHLQNTLKKAGQSVSSQEVIGRIGQSGSIVKPTLHFEIRYHQKAQDPMLWLIRE